MTFDDGPSATGTPELLELLRAYRAKATFFSIARNATSEAELLRQILQDGHEVGSHSFRHMHAWKDNPIRVCRDIKEGFDLLSNVMHRRLFRPPFGKTNLATLIQLWANRVTICWWTIDSGDTFRKPHAVSEVLEQIRIAGGGVVLLHDHARASDQGLNKHTKEVTREILQMAANENYRVCRMSELYPKPSK